MCGSLSGFTRQQVRRVPTGRRLSALRIPPDDADGLLMFGGDEPGRPHLQSLLPSVGRLRLLCGVRVVSGLCLRKRRGAASITRTRVSFFASAASRAWR